VRLEVQTPPVALFVSIFLTIVLGPAWQVGGTRSSIRFVIFACKNMIGGTHK
jgi:hypothetical protein